MDHFRIIKRAFNISWAYKALWVFGVLLALTSGGSGGNGGGSSGGSGGGGNGGGFPTPPSNGWPPQMPEIPQQWVAILTGLICFIVALIVLFTILKYVAHTALIRMVDDYERAGEKVSVGQGFRLGWNRAAFRSWLAGLLLGLLGLLVFALSVALIAAPQLLWLANNQPLGILAVVLSVGLLFLMILVWIVFFSALSIISELAHRAVVLEGLGPMQGVRRGWAMFRARLGDSIIMGLIIFGMRLVLSILTIPVFFLLVLAGVATGVLPGLLAGGITNIFAQGDAAQIVGFVIGGLIALLVVLSPLLFISGLWETVRSSTWTLTFRELLAPGSAAAAPAPAPVPPVE